MSSLLNLLNPEAGYQSPPHTDMEKLPHSASPSSSTSRRSARTTTDGAHYSREGAPSGEHEMHPDCPDTLNCLPDTDGRPQHTLPVILRCAILGSPRKRLTIREIYAAMEDKYPYYKTAGPTWKQSVRHHLSLNRLFERQPRPVTDPGFGSYWTVNLTAPPGTKRPRKRGRPNRDIHDDSAPPPVKRRGRPRKNPPQLPPIATLGVPTDRAVRNCHVSSLRPGGDQFEEDEAEEEMISEDGDVDHTDDDYESEEDMVYPFENHATITGRTALGSHGSFSHTIRPLVPASFPQFGTADSGENLIDKLHIEMEGLRRLAADAQALSQRTSDQLSEAQGEAHRAKSALKRAEAMLEEEGRKRQEAERLADEEARRRRAAEEALRHAQMQRSPSSRTK